MPKAPLAFATGIREIRKSGNVPICVLYWEAKSETIRYSLFSDVTAEEAAALLEPIGITFKNSDSDKDEEDEDSVS